MSTKKPIATLLQAATVKVVEPVQTTLVPEPPKPGSPYASLFAELPGDPAEKVWLLEQIEVSRNWGSELLRINSDTLIALCDRALGK